MIIKNNLIPFNGFTAMAVFPFIFVRKDWLERLKSSYTKTWPSVYSRVLNHEAIHFAQQIEMLLVGCLIALISIAVFGFTWWFIPIPFILFYVLYGLSWLWHLSKVKFEDPK